MKKIKLATLLVALLVGSGFVQAAVVLVGSNPGALVNGSFEDPSDWTVTSVNFPGSSPGYIGINPTVGTHHGASSLNFENSSTTAKATVPSAIDVGDEVTFSAWIKTDGVDPLKYSFQIFSADGSQSFPLLVGSVNSNGEWREVTATTTSTFSSASWELRIGGNNLNTNGSLAAIDSVTVVPEPSSSLLITFATLGFVLRRRR